MAIFLVSQPVPDVLDAEKMSQAEGARYRLVDPVSRRELALVKACSTTEGWIDFYRTYVCAPDDPQCIRFDTRPICRRFAEHVIEGGFLRCPTFRKYRDFDLVERETGAVVRQVRPARQSSRHHG